MIDKNKKTMRIAKEFENKPLKISLKRLFIGFANFKKKEELFSEQ